MKTTIVIVRHTETIGNIEKRLTGKHDYEITPRGEILISKLTQELKDIPFDKVYSSPSGRAIKTVEPLAKWNKVPVEIDQELSEIFFGEYDGWKWEDVNRIHPNIKATQNKINEICGIPGQETMQEVAQRMYQCILKIAQNNEGKNILICSHGVAIEAFLRKITGVAFCYEREKYCQYNVAINELVYEKNEFHIMRLADIKYLGGE